MRLRNRKQTDMKRLEADLTAKFHESYSVLLEEMKPIKEDNKKLKADVAECELAASEALKELRELRTLVTTLSKIALSIQESKSDV